MTPNSTHVQLITTSDPYTKWARKYPIDADKIRRRLNGDRTTEPGSLFGQGLARLIVTAPYMPDVKVHVETVIRSQPYQEWAYYKTASGARPHLTDHNKVMKRLAGDKTTEPSSNLAKGLARILYQPIRQPDEPPPPPPDGTPKWPADSGYMHDVWKKDLVYVRTLSSFHGLLRQEARANGWPVIAVQADHAYYVEDNMRELAAIRGTLVSQGHIIVGWATYGQGQLSPFDEGRQHAEIAKRHFPDGWIGNGEAWAEGPDWWKTAAWIEGWLSNGGASIPVACSCLSSTTPDWAREFDYPSWLALPGSAIMPQVYGATITAYTVHNAIETLKRGRVPKNRVGLTFDVIEGVGPFPDYKTWLGPRQLWTGDDSRSGTFAALAQTVALGQAQAIA